MEKNLYDLENNCVKGDDSNSPQNVLGCKILNYYHTGIKGSSNQVHESTQLELARTLNCYNCRKLDCTIKTCPNYSKTNNFNVSRDNNNKKTGKTEPRWHKNKSFPQVKDKPKANPKKTQKASE